MCWQQVEENSFIIQLDSLHVISLFFCLWGQRKRKSLPKSKKLAEAMK